MSVESGADTRTPTRAWLVWGLGVFAYAIAVFQRTSLGVTGIAAQHRFGAGAAALSTFSVLQLFVYAAMQVPAGVLLDHLGSRRMIAIGGLTMAGGQFLLATADSVPAAVGARVLVGAGDAMTFISVLRLVSVWFAPRLAAVMTQVTGIVGQTGQIAAAYPLVTLLHRIGWTRSFEIAASVGLVVSVLVAVTLQDVPAGTGGPRPPPQLSVIRGHLRDAWQELGTRLGLWIHFVTQFSGNVFGLLWGFPFLVSGEGLSPSTAGLLISLLVVVGMVVGPVLGRLAGGWPMRRSVLALTVVNSSMLAWTVVLVWPGRAPLPVLVGLVVVLGTNGPGSLLAFDLARTENPSVRHGSASGIVNVGGFVASLITIELIGLVLNSLGQDSPGSYTLGGFKAAFCVQYLFWVIGLVGILRTRRKLRAQRGIELEPFPRAVIRRVRSR